MFKNTKAFQSFSVDDLEKAKAFYSEVLGLEVEDYPDMGIKVHIAGSTPIFVYPKGKDHVPATFTVLNFPVADVDTAVNVLVAKGVKFEQYPHMGTDAKGVARETGGPVIAWFKDPAGNVLSVIAENK